MKLSEIVVDVKAQEEGEWREHPYFDGVTVLVKSIHSETFDKRVTQLTNRLPMKRRKIGDSVRETERIQRLSLAVLVGGWKGIDDEHGAPIPFAPELVQEWADDKRYRRFFDGIRELAQEIGEGEPEAQTERLGN